MFVNSALNEGLAGMQQSQRKMSQLAHDIVRSGMPKDSPLPNPGAPVANSTVGTAADDLAAHQSLGAVDTSGKLTQDTRRYDDPVPYLVEQKMQQHVFDASAKIVKTANDMLGTLIDDLS